jgi:hypothetical protein
MKKLILLVLLVGCTRAYPDNIRNEFVDGCTKGAIVEGDSESTIALMRARCECGIDEIQKVYTLEEYIEVQDDMKGGGKFPAKMRAAMAKCKDEGG